MAALTRSETANYEVHENVVVDTLDREDHTFCGVVFPVKAKEDLPVSRIIVRSIAVRGTLGPMAVFVSKNRTQPQDGFNMVASEQYWNKIYSRDHPPSRRKYQILDFSNKPLVLVPGETRLIYVHSRAPHDRAIVYDNTNNDTGTRYEDSLLSIHTGMAHLSPEPFGRETFWGWGSAWRMRREFVGRLHYGAIYQLWHPEKHLQFGSNFQDGARSLFLCQRRYESPISMLPDECIFYILHLCRWDWFDDSPGSASADSRRRRKSRLLIEQQKHQLINPRFYRENKTIFLQFFSVLAVVSAYLAPSLYKKFKKTET